MKRILIVSALLFGVTFLSFSQLSGNYTVGSGGDYGTLGEAISALNSGTAGGHIRFTITSNLTESGDVTVSVTAGLDASDTLGITSSGSYTVTFPAGNGFRTGGADYITIDGTKGGGTLTMKHSGHSAGNSVVWIEGLSDNITVKNCTLGATSNVPDYAIKTSGSLSNKINNVTILDNTIHGVGNSNGIIYFLYVQGTNSIKGNTISGDSTGSSNAFGILLQNCAGTTTIEKNRMTTLKTSAGSGYNFAGVEELSSTSGNLNIYNNFVGGNFSSSSTTNYYLLSLQGSSTKKVYHNTLLMNSIAGSPADAGNLYVFAGTVDFKNNIVINSFDDSKSVCISEDFSFTPSDLTSDYNDLYAPGTLAAGRPSDR